MHESQKTKYSSMKKYFLEKMEFYEEKIEILENDLNLANKTADENKYKYIETFNNLENKVEEFTNFRRNYKNDLTSVLLQLEKNSELRDKFKNSLKDLISEDYVSQTN
jgi:hypothetical protein